MALDFHQVAPQTKALAVHLRKQQVQRHTKLLQALKAINSVRTTDLERRRQISKVAWLIPEPRELLSERICCPSLPREHLVSAVDGSHIDVDRHSPAQFFLLNMGRVSLRYGASPMANLSSKPILYAEDKKLVFDDPASTLRGEPLEGPLLGLHRSVTEIETLVQLTKTLPDDLPLLSLLDGSLILWGLAGQQYPEFVKEILLTQRFVHALDQFHRMSQYRPLSIAAYTSLPRSTEVLNMLRLHCCPYDTANCDQYCSAKSVGDRPCDEVGGILDRDLFMAFLEPGNRSAVFSSTLPLVEKYYREHRICFFYLNVGPEIGRVEIPSWVADNRELLDLTHASLVDQCRKGLGYPAALAEAHEQAVLTTADRRRLQMLIEETLGQERLPVYTSEKQRSKQFKWL